MEKENSFMPQDLEKIVGQPEKGAGEPAEAPAGNETEKNIEEAELNSDSDRRYQRWLKTTEIKRTLTEKTQPISPPLPTTEMYSEGHKAYREVKQAEEEVKKRLEPIRKQLEAELVSKPETHYKELNIRLGQQAREILTRWVEEVYGGQYGPGVLVIARNEYPEDGEKPTASLKYFLPIMNTVIPDYTNYPENETNNQKERAERRINCIVGGVVNAEDIIPQPGQPDPRPDLRNIHRVEDVRTPDGANDILSVCDFAEVKPTRVPTAEEFESLWLRIDEAPSEILSLFPKSYQKAHEETNQRFAANLKREKEQEERWEKEWGGTRREIIKEAIQVLDENPELLKRVLGREQ